MATITGTSGNDSLVGTAENDSISGLDGNDSIAGAGGNDTVRGNGGTDWLEGGTGNDDLGGGSGQDSFALRAIGSANADLLFDFASGWDNIQLDAAVFTSLGTAGRFSTGDARFRAGTAAQDADDRIIFNSATGQLFYDADGSGAGAQQLIATLPAGRTVIASDFWVFGTPPSGGGVITGTNGNDSLTGTAGNDSMQGLAGNDTLNGLAGADTMDGGLHDDLYIVDNTGDVVIELEGGGSNDEIQSSVSYTLPAFVNNLTLTGSANINGTGNELANIIVGNSGNNVLAGGAGDDTMQGGLGNDTYMSEAIREFGSPGDSLSDSGGLDTVIVDGNGASLRPATGVENLTLRGYDPQFGVSAIGNALNNVIRDEGGGGTFIDGEGGNDTLIGNAGGQFFTFSGNFTLGAGNSPDYGHDSVDGGGGRDWFLLENNSAVVLDFSTGTMTGGADGASASVTFTNIEAAVGTLFDDRMVANNLGNELRGYSGNDTIIGGTGSDVLDGDGAFDHPTGEFGNDSLVGGGGNDTLFGDQGNDTMDGGAGNDMLRGSSGDFGAASGADQFHFTATPGLANADLIDEFDAGVDKIVLDGNAHASSGASGNFAAGDARFRLGTAAQDGDDRVIYDGATGRLWYDADGSGTAMQQQLIARLQNTPSLTATDIAIINGSGGGSGTINGTAGNDTLMGTDGNDTINGLGGHDSLYGALGADSMIGGDGNDTLDGSNIFRNEDFEADADTMDGGLGNDLFYVNNVADVLRDAGGTDTVYIRDRDWTLGAGFENLVINTDFGEFATTGTGNELANVMEGTWHIRLEGLGGNDLILGAQRHDTLLGGDGNDTVDGGGGNDSIEGGAGNDVLRETQFTRFNGSVDNSSGSDTMNGGTGNDTLTGGTESDTLTGGAGADTFAFDQAPDDTTADLITDFLSGSDRLQLDALVFGNLGSSGSFASGDARFRSGTSAQDADDRVIYHSATGRLWYDADGNGAGTQQLMATLQAGAVLAATDISVINGTTPPPSGVITGTPGNDSLTGTNGNDTIDGGAGNDTMNGLLGNDTYFVNPGDVIQDSGGIDTIFAAASFALPSPIENITYTGTANTSSVGNSLNNRMTGNSGRNYLEGRGGNDTLAGGTGVDTLNGGVGNDVFVFSEMGTANADAINGFISAEDDLAFDDAVFADLGSAGSFRSGAGLSTGQDADDRLIYNSSTGQLYYDADGSGGGGSQLVATLAGAPGLTASDITLV